jgi:glycosyltransferase involved in cell wall biosynthesis
VTDVRARSSAGTALAARSMFIVWAARHRGTRSAWIAESLAVDELRYFAPTSGRGMAAALRKYPVQLLSTIWALVRARPRILLVQSPPSFAAWTSALYSAVRRSVYLVDAHSDAFERGIWTRPAWITRLVARGAVATIVTNEHWAEMVRGWGGRAICVPSIPVEFAVGGAPALPPGPNVAVVNTWARDEPLREVLEAARELPGVTFHVTGRNDRVAQLDPPPAPNVHFTGFLAEADYHALLRAADAVVCLTTRNHTMQNGACEALAHGTPIVTSDWPVLRDYFSAGAAHVDNSAEGIKRGVEAVLRDPEAYRTSVRLLREQRTAEWMQTRQHILDLVNAAIDRG